MDRQKRKAAISVLLMVSMGHLLNDMFQAVIPSIYFDNEFLRQSHKICNVVSYDMLSSEPYSTLRSADGVPQYAFCFCLILSVFL